VADANKDAAELVGELVESGDRVPYCSLRVGVLVEQVITDRVDDDQSDIADPEGELLKAWDVARQPEVLGDDVDPFAVAEPAASIRGPMSMLALSSLEMRMTFLGPLKNLPRLMRAASPHVHVPFALPFLPASRWKAPRCRNGLSIHSMCRLPSFRSNQDHFGRTDVRIRVGWSRERDDPLSRAVSAK
jgi:hypothetical protein